MTSDISPLVAVESDAKTQNKPLGLAVIIAALMATFLSAIYIINVAITPLEFTGIKIPTARYAAGDQSTIDTRVLGKYQTDSFIPVSLPFTPAQPERSHISTFVLQFEKPSFTEPVIIFHAIQDSAKIWLNDMLVNEIGEVNLPPNHQAPRNWHTPNLIRLPPALLKETNTLELHVISRLEAALGDVTVAEYKDVKSEMAWHTFWRVNFLWVGISFAIPAAIFFLSVWLFYRQKTEYLWLGIVMAVWPFNTFAMTFTNTALNKVLTTLLQEPSNLLYATALVSFTFVYRGTYERAIPYIWVISACVLSFFVVDILNPTMGLPKGLGLGVLYGWIAGVSLFSLWVILANAFERRNIRSLIMAMSGVLVETIAVWDILPLIGVVEGNPLTYIVQWGVISVLVSYSAVMSYELALALKKSDKYNAQLTHEVSIKTDQLKQQYEDILYLEKQQVMSDERSRLISDMHDGTSGQIVSIIAGLKSGRLSNEHCIQQLQYCVQDLRLILDSMNPQATDDLASALALFRQRIDPLLIAAGLKTRWNTAHISDGVRFSPHELLNIFRILQEALTNVIKHAQANEVHISAEEGSEFISLFVFDNGIGMPKETDHKTKPNGYGLISMQKRARNIQAELTFNPGVKAGFNIALTLKHLHKI